MTAPGRRLDPRLGLAVTGARAVSLLSRTLRLGGGTAAPGRVASRIDPAVLEKLTRRRLSDGVVIVAGTNGKTTTARLLAEILAARGHSVVHNRAGANLLSGIVATLALDSTRRLPAIAVFESDEAVLPQLLGRVTPRLLVLANLFRDQLDRYGEVDLVVDHWRRALARLDPETTVVANGDDPSLVALTEDLRCGRLLYGVDDPCHALPAVPHAGEALRCRICSAPLAYDTVYVGHLGAWHCLRCGARRPLLDAVARGIAFTSAGSQSFEYAADDATTGVTARLPGLYNTYNLVAALTVAAALGTPPAQARSAVADYRGAFGRAEQVVFRGRRMTFMLVKNPVGAEEVLRTIASTVTGSSDSTAPAGRAAPPILACLNNAAADGRDVSWIWDVDVEAYASCAGDVYCAGSRFADLANRLHYAGFPDERLHPLGPDLASALRTYAAALPADSAGFVVATYTAVLALRTVLAAEDASRQFWED